MRIVIETKGDLESKIAINGEKLEDSLKEFNLTIKAGRKPKLQMIREFAGENVFQTLYGGDFEKYDEVHLIKKEN